MRLAVFVDQVFWCEGATLSTDGSYALFPASFASHEDSVVFIGRKAPQPGRAPYILDLPNISFEPMPYYPNLYALWRADPRIYGEIRRRIRQAARTWDALIVGGPHPIGQMIARQCIALGVPVALNIRQNLVTQMSVHRGLKRAAAMTAAWLLERDFRRLARGRTVFTVGHEMASEYRRFSDRVHEYFPCLVTDEQFRRFSAVPRNVDPTRLLCVGRLSSEKGIGFLLEAMALLKRRGLTCRLDIVGNGPQEQELRNKAAGFGLESEVVFHGYVPYGPALFDLYQRAGVLVLPSLTEGFPQVINEALCVGVPTIASRVGGIPDFLTDGETALLVPPGEAAALAAAIERLAGDAGFLERLSHNGRALMAENTLEANRARVLNIIRNEVLEDADRRRSADGRQAPEGVG